jgi:hypothetical protein
MPKKFDVREFEAFCRSKGDEEFDPNEGHSCAGFQFLKAQGEPVAWCGVFNWYDRQDEPHAFPEAVSDVLALAADAARPMAFSALADRLSRVDS